MDSDNNQENDHKTIQRARATSILLQTNTRIRTPEQQHIICFQWKLR